MPKPELSIHFDEPTRSFTPGAAITGRVVVEVSDPARCKRLVISRFFRTHGRGNRDEGERLKTVLGEEMEWNQPGRHEFPFQFEAPADPFSYHGHYVNVDWYLEARIEIPWAIDVKQREDFLLSPAMPRAPLPPAAEPDETGVFSRGCLAFIGMILVVAALFAFIQGRAHSGFGNHELFGGIAAMFGFGLVYLGSRLRMATRRLGDVKVLLDPGKARAGHPLACRIDFAPNTTLVFDAIDLKIRGREQAISGTGSDRTTHTHVIHEEKLTLQQERAHPAGVPVNYEVRFDLPDDVPFSFNTGENLVEWSLEVRIRLPGPDWIKTYEFEVLP